RTGGTLWGWGNNGNGQLGNGTTTSSTTPVQIGVVTNWKSVSSGASFALAVRLDGTLWAWGLNSSGQVGDGTTTQRTSPVQIGAATNWAAVSAGNAHAIALKTDGTLWAWGSNVNGELGQGTSDALTTHTSPMQVGIVTTWSSISAGNNHVLATRTDGTLWAWGLNSSGQIGNNSTTTVTAPIQIGTVATWNSISAGYVFSAATRTDGTLWLWGNNSDGQIADNTLINRTAPTQLGAATNWQYVQAGGYHVLATKTDGTFWSWGWNQNGQLGQGFNDFTPRGNTPAQIGTATNWSLLSPGYDFSVAMKTDGTLWSWGDNGNNELGYLGRVPLPLAEQFGPISSASAGNGHAAAIKSDGSLWLWGNNGNGQVGIGASDSSQHPVPVQPAPGTTWSNIACGGFHTAGVRSDGTLWTWGYNFYGQLGDGTTTQRNSPMQVGAATNWVEVATGFYNTIALKADGTLWAWGYNFDGQLGNGVSDTLSHPTMTQVGTATNWTHVVTHGYHIIATRSDGTLWGWGFNSSGQVGNGSTTTPVTTPIQIGIATNWRSIATGQFHTTAIRSDGTLWSWGQNGSGQLGDGTTTNRSSPVQIGIATNWETVADGYTHTLATKNDGSLWTWGLNSSLQLGNASTVNRSAPAQVGISTGWDNVFPSSNQTLLGTVDGSLWACGFANNGSLGYAWRNQFVPDLVLPALSPVQTIVFSAPASVTVGNTITLAATAGSGLPVSYIVGGPATLNGSQLTVTGPGLVTIIAYQPGDNFWQSSDIAVQYVNAPPPTVTGVSVSALPVTTATISATINPNGTATTAKFQSGTTNAYGTDTPITLLPVNGFSDQGVSTLLTGLIPGTTYHFRVTGTNDGGTTTTSDFTFTTVTAAYAAWAAANGLSGPNAGPGADFDGDGLPNVLEWGFGTNPSSANRGALAVNGATITARGTPITITETDAFGGVNHFAAFARRKDYLTLGLSYTVQFTVNFSTWTANGVTPTVIASDSEMEIVTVPYPAAIDDGEYAFFNVGISAP
ncbi:MAG: hypothetical protein ABIP20_18700, partial [Chthoniobacteraceae bacterium]